MTIKGRDIQDLTTVLFFLQGAAEDGQMYNSHRADEAVRAFCRLVEIDHATFLLKHLNLEPKRI